jgi:hypothetical protein
VLLSFISYFCYGYGYGYGYGYAKAAFYYYNNNNMNMNMNMNMNRYLYLRNRNAQYKINKSYLCLKNSRGFKCKLIIFQQHFPVQLPCYDF